MRVADRSLIEKDSTRALPCVASLSASPMVGATNKSGDTPPLRPGFRSDLPAEDDPTCSYRSDATHDTAVPVAGSYHSLAMMPCRLGEHPVTIEACPAEVTVMA